MKKMKTEKTTPDAFKRGKAGLDEILVDQWIAEHYEGPEDISGKEGLLARLTKAVVERALGAELTHHLGYAKGGTPEEAVDNCRNGIRFAIARREVAATIVWLIDPELLTR